MEPDWKAWKDLLPGKVEPAHIVRLSIDGKKTTVYRVPVAGACTVIAKLCPCEVAGLERIIYERVLPHLPLTAPRYYGSVEAGGECTWVLLEEVQGQKFSLMLEEHRVLAARWLGVLHSRAAAIMPPPPLPQRGPAHYRECLRIGRELILDSLGNPAIESEDSAFLETVVGLCDAIETHWPWIDAFCAPLPVTLVHGDFRPKNVRVRAHGGEVALFPMDWEMAGWAVPAVDLVPARGFPTLPLVDLPTYESVVKEHWPGPAVTSLRRLARLGALFRRLAAIHWAGLSLGSQWPQKALASLKVYHAELEEALCDPPWAELLKQGAADGET